MIKVLGDMYEQEFSDTPLKGLLIQKIEGEARQMVLLLHGYQGDSKTNMKFARTLSEALPHASVYVPDGLDKVAGQDDPRKRQWFNLPSFRGNVCSHYPNYLPPEEQDIQESVKREMNVSAGILNRFIKKKLKQHELSLKDLFIVGISQGGMLAFEMALFRNELSNPENGDTLGGLAVIGSGLIGPDRFRKKPPATYPRVLLVGGWQDEIFPPVVHRFTSSVLRENHLSVRLEFVNAGHFGLEHEGAWAVSDFLQDCAKWQNR